MKRAEAWGYFRDLKELVATEPDIQNRKAFLAGEKDTEQYRRAWSTIFPRSETARVQERSEPMSDAALGRLTAAMGNHDGQCILLSAMSLRESQLPRTRRGIVYTFSSSADLVNSIQQGFDGWNVNAAYAWLSDSMASIDLVVKDEILDDRNTLGYRITEKGEDDGVPLAGHLLRFSEKRPGRWLGDYFGATNSRDAESDEDTGKQPDERKRAPLTRIKIYRELLKRKPTKDNPMKKKDLLSAIGEEERGDNIRPQLVSLEADGIISYEAISDEKAYSAFSVAASPPDTDPGEHAKRKRITRRVWGIVQTIEGEVTSELVQQRMITEYPDEYTSTDRSNVQKALSDLTEAGFLERYGFKRDDMTRLWLTPEQQADLGELVTILDMFQARDPEFLRQGRQLAHAFVTDPERVARHMKKTQELSSHAGSQGKEANMAAIQGIINHTDSTNVASIVRELRAQGIRLREGRVSQLAKEITDDPQSGITRVRTGRGYTYKAIEAASGNGN